MGRRIRRNGRRIIIRLMIRFFYKETNKSKIKCSAPEYINFTFNEINLLIADPEIFPTKYGYPFKENFVNSTIKRILKMLINVLCHFYTHKVFARLYEQSLHTRLNRVFSHAILLIKHAELKDVVDFRAHCLTDLIAVLTER